MSYQCDVYVAFIPGITGIILTKNYSETICPIG